MYKLYVRMRACGCVRGWVGGWVGGCVGAWLGGSTEADVAICREVSSPDQRIRLACFDSFVVVSDVDPGHSLSSWMYT